MNGEPQHPDRTTADPPLVERVALLVTHEPSLAGVLGQVARILADEFSADGCLVYRVEPDGGLVVAASHPTPLPGDPLRLPGGFGVTVRVAADCIPVVLVDDNPRNLRHRQLLGLRDGERVSRLCVPARVAGEGCVAVIAVHSRRHRNFSSTEVGVAQQAADLVGLRTRLSDACDAIGRYRDERDRLVANTVAAQEAERRRTAGDLHDGVNQALASLRFHLSAAQLALAEQDVMFATDQVRAAVSLADLALGEIHSAITGLHSPVLEDLGLAAGLVSMARGIPNLRVDVDAQDVWLPDYVSTSLFRIAQEAVHNVVKHAATDTAMVRLAKHGHSVVLTVTDAGQGFDAQWQPVAPLDGPDVSTYGLTGMSERVALIGAELQISSQPGEGTTVEVTVPNVL